MVSKSPTKPTTKPKTPRKSRATPKEDLINKLIDKSNLYEKHENWAILCEITGIPADLLIKFAGEWALILDPYKAGKLCSIPYDIVFFLMEDEDHRKFLSRYKQQRLKLIGSLPGDCSVEVVKGMMLSLATRYSQVSEILAEAPSDKKWLADTLENILGDS